MEFKNKHESDESIDNERITTMPIIVIYALFEVCIHWNSGMAEKVDQNNDAVLLGSTNDTKFDKKDSDNDTEFNENDSDIDDSGYCSGEECEYNYKTFEVLINSDTEMLDELEMDTQIKDSLDTEFWISKLPIPRSCSGSKYCKSYDDGPFIVMSSHSYRWTIISVVKTSRKSVCNKFNGVYESYDCC